MSENMKGKQYSLGTVRSVEYRKRLSDYWAANREKHNHWVDGRCDERLSERVNAMRKLEYRLWKYGRSSNLQRVRSTDIQRCFGQHCGPCDITWKRD